MFKASTRGCRTFYQRRYKNAGSRRLRVLRALRGGAARLVVRIVGFHVSLVRGQSLGAQLRSTQHTEPPASSSRGSSRICEYEIEGGMGWGGCEEGHVWQKRTS